VPITTRQSRRSTQAWAKSASRLLFAAPPIPTKKKHNRNEQHIPSQCIKCIYMFVRVVYLERDDADQDAQDEEDERDREPDDTPHFIVD
jgi:hypothetical protein